MNIKKQNPISKKSNKKMVTSIIILIIIILICVSIIPIINQIEKTKFDTLNTQMKSLFNSIKDVDKKDNWDYTAKCEAERSGPWATGNFFCSTEIKLEKTISSVDELNDIQTKYFSIIDNSEYLIKQTELSTSPVADFGKKFVVSGAEKRYVNKNNNIECSYLLKLQQVTSSDDFHSTLLGAPIENNKGTGRLTLICSNISRKEWF